MSTPVKLIDYRQSRTQRRYVKLQEREARQEITGLRRREAVAIFVRNLVTHEWVEAPLKFKVAFIYTENGQEVHEVVDPPRGHDRGAPLYEFQKALVLLQYPNIQVRKVR